MTGAQQRYRGAELAARVGVIPCKARLEVFAQVFWTTMFGNLDVMSRCDSAIFTAQRRAMRR